MAQDTTTRESSPADDAYLKARTLRRGSAGWLLLTGLGVAYVVSGDFSGWNIGLSTGGFGGLAVATVLMGAMYACLVFALAELSAILPTAGGGYGFARRALGTWGGFLTIQRRWIRKQSKTPFEDQDHIAREEWPESEMWRDIVPSPEFFEEEDSAEDEDPEEQSA